MLGGLYDIDVRGMDQRLEQNPLFAFFIHYELLSSIIAGNIMSGFSK